jgi:hypothetical protein
VFAYRLGPFHYRVVLEPEIRLDACGREESASSATAEFCRRLEKNVLAHPADWERWSARDPRDL